MERPVRPDEAFLYDESVVEPSKEEFGDVMMDIKNLGPRGKPYSWQQLASYTGLKRSTIKSVTKKELSPPRSLAFLENIRKIPGVTEEHVQRLINAADSPNWLAVVSRHFQSGDEGEHRIYTVSDDGVDIIIGVKLDQSKYSELELDLLSAQIKKQVEGAISMFDVLRDLNRESPTLGSGEISGEGANFAGDSQ